jgi:hypothetical protein
MALRTRQMMRRRNQVWYTYGESYRAATSKHTQQMENRR